MRLVRRAAWLVSTGIAVCGWFASSSQGGLINVNDTSLAAWGITVADGASQFYGNPQVANPTTVGFKGRMDLPNSLKVYYHADDQPDSGYPYSTDNGFVQPEYGGQNYDAEFMGVTLDGSKLAIVIVSGQRPDSGLPRYGPGDIRIVTSVGTFGIEVGGGAGGGPGNTIYGGEPGTTYNLTSQGYTGSVGATNAARVAGSIWKDPTWKQSTVVAGAFTQIESASDLRGQSNYTYTRNDVTSQHSIIQLEFDAIDVIGAGAKILSVEWSPSCGNDDLLVEPRDMTVPTPEPRSLVIWSLFGGVACLLGVRSARKIA